MFVGYAKEASDISFGRMLSEEEVVGPEWREHVKRVVEKKSEKLKRHKENGRETWLVAYNTFWTAMSIVDVRDAVLAALRPEHSHIDHVAMVAGDPPDDAWVDTHPVDRVSRSAPMWRSHPNGRRLGLYLPGRARKSIRPEITASSIEDGMGRVGLLATHPQQAIRLSRPRENPGHRSRQGGGLVWVSFMTVARW